MSDFQRHAVEQGQLFDQQCRYVLRSFGVDVAERPERVPSLGIEVDAVVRTLDDRTFWCEFKGSWLGSRPGMRRTDTVKKALAVGLLAHVHQDSWPSVLLLTSHLPKPGSAGAAMLDVGVRVGAFEVFNINEPDDLKHLDELLRAQP